MTLIVRLLLCLSLSFVTVAAAAQGTSVAFGTLQQNPDDPVEITADTLSVDQDTGRATFVGNVLVGQGEMRLSAPRVLVVYNETNSGIDSVSATGGVTLVSGPDAAESQKADYDIGSGVIVMTGDVLLTQGASALTSERMTVNMRDGTARMVGRVKTVFQSKDN